MEVVVDLALCLSRPWRCIRDARGRLHSYADVGVPHGNSRAITRILNLVYRSPRRNCDVPMATASSLSPPGEKGRLEARRRTRASCARWGPRVPEGIARIQCFRRHLLRVAGCMRVWRWQPGVRGGAGGYSYAMYICIFVRTVLGEALFFFNMVDNQRKTQL